MIVSGKNSLKTRKLYRERSERAIEYARKQIEESAVAPYVSKLYLYGSCVREEQTYQSDVDLMLELKPTFDMKIMIGDKWKNEHTLFFENIKKEGRDIWKGE